MIYSRTLIFRIGISIWFRCSFLLAEPSQGTWTTPALNMAIQDENFQVDPGSWPSHHFSRNLQGYWSRTTETHQIFLLSLLLLFFCRIESIVSRPFAVRIDLFSNFCSGRREYPNNTDSGHWTVSKVRGTQISYNPLHLNISKRFLQTVLYKFPKKSRICVTVKSFFGRWSFPSFSWP